MPGLDSPLHVDDSIHRVVMPVKSIAKIEALEIDGLAKGTGILFDAALGFDVVKPTTAKVLAKCDGRPAILENEFGNGRCYFVAANYFAHAHLASFAEMMPDRLEFWPGVIDAIGAMVRSGYTAAGVSLPVEITGVSYEVEVSVDDHGDKYVVHLLDYDLKGEKIAGARLVVPGSRRIKRVYYPGEKRPLNLDGRTAELREFSVYDMLVVEFEENKNGG